LDDSITHTFIFWTVVRRGGEATRLLKSAETRAVRVVWTMDAAPRPRLILHFSHILDKKLSIFSVSYF